MNVDSRLVLYVRIRCDSLSITSTVSFLAIEFNVGYQLHGQVGLAAVNHSYAFHEFMNGCKNPKLQNVCFENVNIFR